MRYLLALIFPWLVFFSMGKPIQGVICLVLQVSLIGWIPATIWAFASIAGFNADKRADRIVRSVKAAR